MSCFDYPVDSQTILLKKRALRKELLQKEGLVDKKIAILSGSTIGQIRPVLELFLLHHGIRPTFWEGGYHLYYEDIVFGNEELKAFSPDLIYIHTSGRNLENRPSVYDSDEAAAAKLTAETARWQGLWDAALANFHCPVVQNNFELPTLRVMGNADAVLAQGQVHFVNELNRAAADYAAAHTGFYLQDINWLSSVHGLDRWCDESSWCLYKYALDPELIPELCANLASIIKSVFGRNKKALALDCDNTLWGGVIGDDGAQGIHLGLEDADGMAFSAFQSYLKEVAGLGVLLNVCSKNEEHIAREGFRRAESVLKNEDFIAFMANWEPKSRNLQAMAQQLNIGLTDIVFVDDNPAEREQVRTALPGMPVPELATPEHYARVLDRSGYFEVTTFSKDDRSRNRMYKENVQRAAAQLQFADYADYLRSLEMTAQITPFAPEFLARTTQLINKTNQFNLTTRRYTEDEVRACMEDENCVTLCGRLQDKFGDNGLVSVIIGRKNGEELDVELWIMSCRVFKRDLELAMFDALVVAAAKLGCKRVAGSWLRTAKNALVRDFYPSIGFAVTQEGEDERRFALELDPMPAQKNKVIAIQP